MQYTEANRKHINIVIFIFYLTMIFSGALRKWFFPQLSPILFFSSDLVAAYLYAYILHKRLLPQNSLNKISLYLIIFFGFLIIVQIFWYANLLMVIYGYRNYCFLIPLPIIMAEYMREEDVVRIAKWTCWIGLGSAYLVYLQYNSPPDSFINKTVGLETKKIFVVVKDKVRTSGFFSFTVGQSLFTLTLFLSVFYALFIERSKRFFNPLLIGLFLFGAMCNLAFSGSRTAYGYIIILLSSLLVAGFVLVKKKYGKMLLLYTALGLAVGVVLFPVLFSENMSDMSERLENSSKTEGDILNRILLPFEVAIAPLKHDIPIIGLGLGAQSPGAQELKNQYSATINYEWFFESEWLRFLAEAGIIAGVIYLIYRLYLTYFMLRLSFIAVRKSDSPIPLLFSISFAHIIFMGQMTFNGVVFVYGWFFLGISLAISNIYLNEVEMECDEEIEEINQ